MRLTWKRPLEYTDNTPIKKGELSGFEILIDDLPAISVPLVEWTTEYSHELDGSSFSEGEHRLRVVAVSKSGMKSVPSVVGSFNIAARTPNPPFDVAVSFAA